MSLANPCFGTSLCADLAEGGMCIPKRIVASGSFIPDPQWEELCESGRGVQWVGELVVGEVGDSEGELVGDLMHPPF